MKDKNANRTMQTLERKHHRIRKNKGDDEYDHIRRDDFTRWN